MSVSYTDEEFVVRPLCGPFSSIRAHVRDHHGWAARARTAPLGRLRWDHDNAHHMGFADHCHGRG